MKIKPPTRLERAMARARSESLRAIDMATKSDRVCGPHCNAACPVCGGTDCRCMCNRKCEEMPAAISSDGAKYPVEPAIAPLVFELTRLGCFEPCWSCEGHTDKQGGLWKLPQLWFYADSMTSIRVLSDVLSELQQTGVTKFVWEITLTHSTSETPTPTFSLHPAGVATSSLALPEMQSDLRAMSESISVRFMDKMRALNDESTAYSDQPDLDWNLSRPAGRGGAAE